MTRAMMFATTTSKRASAGRRTATRRPGCPARHRSRPSTPFLRDVLARHAHAVGSTSTASTVAAPSLAAASERMPEPQPTSSTRAPGRTASLQRLEAHARRLVLAGAERHAGVERDARRRRARASYVAPRRDDDDALAVALDVEVLLPRLRPVLLRDVARSLTSAAMPAARERRRARVGTGSRVAGVRVYAHRRRGVDDGVGFEVGLRERRLDPDVAAR